MLKNIEIGYLLDFYGEFLTEHQRIYLDLYYNQDLSLAEIGETEGISRQGVHDALKRGENTLYEMEDRLGLMARYIKISAKLLVLREQIERLDVTEQSLADKRLVLADIDEITWIWEEGHGV